MKISAAFDPVGPSRKALEQAVTPERPQGAELLIPAIAETFHGKEHSSPGLKGGPDALTPLVGHKAAGAESLAPREGSTLQGTGDKGAVPGVGSISETKQEGVDLVVRGQRQGHGLGVSRLAGVATKVVGKAPYPAVAVQ